MAVAAPQAGNAAADTQRDPIAVEVPPMPGLDTIRPGQSPEQRERIARHYLEAFEEPGAMPPGPASFPVRFANRRPNAHLTPRQLRHYLASCRRTGTYFSLSAGLMVDWSCAGPGVLGRHVVMQLGGVDGDRITEGRVWAGWPPGELPDDARLW
jgi:hypothetical protein